MAGESILGGVERESFEEGITSYMLWIWIVFPDKENVEGDEWNPWSCLLITNKRIIGFGVRVEALENRGLVYIKTTKALEFLLCPLSRKNDFFLGWWAQAS